MFEVVSPSLFCPICSGSAAAGLQTCEGHFYFQIEHWNQMAFENVRLHHQVGLLYLIQYDMKKPKRADHPPVHGFII